MVYTLDEISARVAQAALEYNSRAAEDERIQRVCIFGSYAEGLQTPDSDLDLLVSFSEPTVGFFSLAKVLEAMEAHVDLPVDVVQDPLPQDAFLVITKQVPVYEAA